MNSITRDSRDLNFKYSLRAVAEECLEINNSKGFKNLNANSWPLEGDEDQEEKGFKLATVIGLIMSEGGEALEGLRIGDKENFGEELADIVIRTLNCAYGLDIDLASIILEKMKKNAAREPYHGGKLF